MNENRANIVLERCKQILAGLCMIGDGIVFAEAFSDLLFELEYLGEWGYDFLVRDIFLVCTCLVTAYFLISAFISSGKKAKEEAERQEQMEHEAIRREAEVNVKQAIKQDVKQEVIDELSVEELQELLQNKEQNQTQNARY